MQLRIRIGSRCEVQGMIILQIISTRSLDKLDFVGAADCERAVLAFLIGARLSPGG